jgi:hypothetical protein
MDNAAVESLSFEKHPAAWASELQVSASLAHDAQNDHDVDAACNILEDLAERTSLGARRRFRTSQPCLLIVHESR